METLPMSTPFRPSSPSRSSRRFGFPRAVAAALALLGAAVPSVAFGAESANPVEPTTYHLDTRGNEGNVGSGAAFMPQTPWMILKGGGALALQGNGIDVAGVQSTGALDSLGNTGNIGSGAAVAPQTPRSILMGGGRLAWSVTATDVAGVQVRGDTVVVESVPMDADGPILPEDGYDLLIVPETGP